MKTLVRVSEVECEGLISLLGKQVQIDTLTYIYTGILVGVNEKDLKLDKAALVFDTGALSDKAYKTVEHVGFPKYIMLSTMTGYNETDKKY